MKSPRPALSRAVCLLASILIPATILTNASSAPEVRARQPSRPAPPAKAAACANWPQSLSAWWPFDELSGSVINDIRHGNQATPKPNGTMGNPNGPGVITGKVNRAARFFQNTYHQAPNDASLNFGVGSFSVDAWVRLPSSTLQVIYPIADKLLNVAYPLSSTGYALYARRTPAGLELVLRMGVGRKKAETYTSSILIPPLAWNHIAVTVDRTSNVGTFYVNGVADAATFTPAPGNISNNLDLLIGKSRTGQAASVAGLFLDELELFQAAIPGSAIQAIYNAQSAGKCKTCDLAVSVSNNSGGVYLSLQPTHYTVTLKNVGGLACAGTFPVQSSATAVGQMPPPNLTFQSPLPTPPWTCSTNTDCAAQFSTSPLAPGASTGVVFRLQVQSGHTGFGVFFSAASQFTDSYSGNNSASRSDPAYP